VLCGKLENGAANLKMKSETGTLKLVINQSCSANLKMNTATDTTSWST
jgi:hypothetical protein